MTLLIIYFVLTAIIISMSITELRSLASSKRPSVRAKLYLDINTQRYGAEKAKKTMQMAMTTSGIFVAILYILYYTLIITLMNTLWITIVAVIMIVYAIINFAYVLDTVNSGFETPRYHRAAFIIETGFILTVLTMVIYDLF